MARPMTKEEFKKEYEFKATKRILKKEFPFILDMVPTQDFEEYKALRFVNLIVDPNKLIELYPDKFPKQSSLRKTLFTNDKGEYDAITLGLIVDYNKRSDVEDLEHDIRKTINSIHNSPAIPHEMRMDGRIDVSTFTIPKEFITD